ncbi:MAG: hypothetical protein WBG24_12885, partial [Syntrophobacteria bacterium]
LERDCQKLGHFLLRFSQPLPNLGKLFFIHILSPVYLTPMFHQSLAATVYLTVLSGVLGCSFDRLRTGSPATYWSSTPRIQSPAVVRYHSHLHGLATAIHETPGLAHHTTLWWNVKGFLASSWRI